MNQTLGYNSYASSPWGNIQQVIAQSIENRKIIEEVASIMNERAKVEEKYAQGLDKVVNSFSRLNSKTKQKLSRAIRQFNTFIALFISQFSTKSQLSQQYAIQIYDDIIPLLRNIGSMQTQTIKPFIDDFKKWDKEIYELVQNLIKTEAAYKFKSREYEQQSVLSVIYELCSEYTDDKRQKQSQKAINIAQELYESEKLFKQAVLDNNRYFVKEYRPISESLRQMQVQELDRQICVKDILVRGIIYETSLQKNITYDFEKIAERVQTIDPESNMTTEHLYQIQDKDITYREFTKNSSFIANSINQITSRNDQYFLNLAKELYIETLVEQSLMNQQVEAIGEVAQFISTKTKEVCDFSQSMWNKTDPLQDQDLNQIQSQFKDDAFKRRIFNIFLLKKRLDGSSILDYIQLLNLKTFIMTLLDLSYEEREVCSVRNLMTLTFSFSSETQQLQPLLVDHKIWQNRDFWETVIIENIYESVSNNKTKTPPFDYQNISIITQMIQREKNQILTVLTQISQNMLMFLFPAHITKDIMHKFCSFFQLNQEIYQDLMMAIDGFEEHQKLLQR